MLASELLDEIYAAYRGKTVDRTPAWSEAKAVRAITIANRKIREWATDPNNRWASQFNVTPPNEPGTVATAGTTTLTGTSTSFTDYQVGDKITVSGETVRTIATITSDTVLDVTAAFSNTASGRTFTRTTIVDDADYSYNLHRTFFMPSDYVLVTKTDGTNIQYPIVPPPRRDQYVQALYISGINPKKVTFAQTIDAGIDGATLKVPGYYIPAELSAETDLVPVDIPEWLVYITASELARNDAAKEDQVANLVGQANDLYRKMIDNNNGGAFLQGITITNNMPNVGSATDDDWLD